MAQWIRRRPPEPEIPGSSPGRVTSFCSDTKCMGALGQCKSISIHAAPIFGWGLAAHQCVCLSGQGKVVCQYTIKDRCGSTVCMAFYRRPCGLMDKALVFGTKDCRFESCQGHQLLLAKEARFNSCRKTQRKSFFKNKNKSFDC